MKKLEPTEHQIQDSIIQYLRYKGYYVQRLNSGAIRTAAGGLVRMSAVGTPDIMAFRLEKEWIGPGVNLVFIEVKRPGKKATDLQKMRMRELEEYGARCIVATGIEDLKGGEI